jgi:hypothetical protein
VVVDWRLCGGGDLEANSLDEYRLVLLAVFVLSGEVPRAFLAQSLPAAVFTAGDPGSVARFAAKWNQDANRDLTGYSGDAPDTVAHGPGATGHGLDVDLAGMVFGRGR